MSNQISAEREQYLADEAALKKRREELGLEDPIIISEEGDAVVVDKAESTEIAKPEDVEAWDHKTIEFKGSKWNVRKPTEQALAAFSLSSGKYIPAKMQNDMVGLFILRHMSTESHERVYARLMDPDDAEFDAETLGDLMRTIALLED